jgi:hypothetical membrane protein
VTKDQQALGRIALGLLAIGELIQLGTILWGGAVYPGYDHARQHISELGATGAVTGTAVSWWGFVPSGLFMGGSCLIAAWMLRRSGLAVTACLMLGWYGLSLSAAGVYPCAFECARDEVTFNAMMHDLFGGTGYLTGIIGMGLAGLWARASRAPWLAPLGAVCVMIAVVGFGAIIVEAEFGGLFQRGLEGAIAVFLLAFGWALANGRLTPPRDTTAAG